MLFKRNGFLILYSEFKIKLISSKPGEGGIEADTMDQITF